VAAQIPLAFVFGLVSFATPCVLPLVPGYLAAVSGSAPGTTGRRVVLASLPFVAGFSAIFVALGVAAGLVGGVFDDQRLLQHIAGVIVVVFGFAMMGLLPLPFLERLAAPELVEGARKSGSSVLLGGAFAVCAAPCIGPLLATALALAAAGNAGAVGKGSVLLFAYSLGLAVPFVAVGVASGRVMGAFRWLRDHYAVLRVVSGAILIGIGLLLFFDRFWWLNVLVNRAKLWLGLGD
jgi:cytochrome c-type biogenesis protein